MVTRGSTVRVRQRASRKFLQVSSLFTSEATGFGLDVHRTSTDFVAARSAWLENSVVGSVVYFSDDRHDAVTQSQEPRRRW
jgi:hypothetical protein